MKRIVIMLLIACSTITTISAEPSAAPQKKPESVIATLNAIIHKMGKDEGQVYSVNRNPNTGIVESSTKIVPFHCLAIHDKNDFTQRNVALLNDQLMSSVSRNFQKDEPLAYQFLHVQPGSNENFSLKIITDNGSNQGTLRIRTKPNQEMWMMCCKNPENPQLRDAYAITWALTADKRNIEGTIYMITSLRPDVYEKNFESNKRMFKIVGRVDENIKDSLYNIYIAESRDALYNLQDHEYVACVPVINKRFEWQTELTKPCVGRLRCIFPDGSLCSAWIDLDFVPGETYNITVHNGYYDEDKDYERRVGRQSGKSLIEPDAVKVVDEVPAKYQQATAVQPQDWRNALTAQQQAQLQLKAELVQMHIEKIKATFEDAGQGVKGGIERYGKFPGFSGVVEIDNNYEQIYQQNKELDKKYQEVIKLAKRLNVPTEEMPNLYKEILKFYTEQNQALIKLSTSGAAQTKQAKKTQKFVNDLMEKYINELTVALQ